MNERIRELAEQTKEFMDGSDDLDIFVQKFAELIAWECIQQVTEAIPETNCSASAAYRTARIATLSRIKEHFGVEE
jgi:hypothetical protein